ncbi:MAG: hypothetical protein H6908_03375 [Hyphomicrobiales bacterium]|nr:hypothetical protein [Hyphomicrobiales bacterium]
MKFIVTLALLGALLSTSALADDVTEAIQDGLEKYTSGKLSEAASQLDFAATLIRQQKADHAKKILPEPLEGWTTQDTESSTTGDGIFGAVSVSRTYRHTVGGVIKELSITIVSDSPMVQTMAMMLNNPMMASISGGKYTKVGDQKIVIRTEGDQCSGMAMVDSRIMVTIEGAVPEEDILAYFKVIDFESLRNI